MIPVAFRKNSIFVNQAFRFLPEAKTRHKGCTIEKSYRTTNKLYYMIVQDSSRDTTLLETRVHQKDNECPEEVPSINVCLVSSVIFQDSIFFGSKDSASLNMADMDSTPEMSQSFKFWLNSVAPLNIYAISVTEEVTNVSIGWLNALAKENIDPISVTEEVSKEARGWLNSLAKENI